MKRKASEIRSAAVLAVLEGKLSVQDALSIFHISKSSLYLWIKIYKEEGRLTHKTPPGRPPILSQEQKEQILAIVDEQPDITLSELASQLGITVSLATLHNFLRQSGYAYKKNAQGFGTRSQRHKSSQGGLEQDAKKYIHASYRMP